MQVVDSVEPCVDHCHRCVQMVDEAGAPLAGVLLSLSGGANYRSNSLSVADGQKSFMSLVGRQSD